MFAFITTPYIIIEIDKTKIVEKDDVTRYLLDVTKTSTTIIYIFPCLIVHTS